MYVASKRKSANGRHDEGLTWNWDAMDESQEDTTPTPRPKTSFFDPDRSRLSQTPRTLSNGRQKRSGGGFVMPSIEHQAKRIKVERTSPEPFSFQARSTPDAKPVTESRRTPAAPKKKQQVGPFIIDDSDEDSDLETEVSPVPKPQDVTPSRPAGPRSTMPSTAEDSRAESKRLRDAAIARKNGSPAGTDRRQDVIKVEPPSDPPLRRAVTKPQIEPIDLTEDDPPSPVAPNRQTSTQTPEKPKDAASLAGSKSSSIMKDRPQQQGYDTRTRETAVANVPEAKQQPEKAPQAFGIPDERSKLSKDESRPQQHGHETGSEQAAPNGSRQTGDQAHKMAQPVASHDSSNSAPAEEIPPQQRTAKQQANGTVGSLPRRVDSVPARPITSKALKAALQPAKATTTLRPQEVLPMPTTQKISAFEELRARLRESELKRNEELQNQEAARAAAFSRNEIADRRKAEQDQQRKQRLVEEAKKRAAAKKEAEEQVRQEAEKRRLLEKEVEQPAVQQEKERKKQLEEQNRIFMEKRKAEKEAQERLRKQQIEKQQAAERAEKERLREERIRKQSERNAQLRSEAPEEVPVDEGRAALPAPMSLSRLAKDAARGAEGPVARDDALPESSPSLQPRSLASLRPGELGKLEASANRDHASSLGEITQVDLKIVHMRDVSMDWATIAHYHESATGVNKSESTLRRRYRQVSAALQERQLPVDPIKRARDGDATARNDINRHFAPPAEPELSAPVLRLNHRQAPPNPAFNSTLPFTPYRNAIVNPAGRRDSATEGRPNVGGKTIDESYFYHMLEQHHQAFVDMDDEEQSEADSAPQERYYYVYYLKRRDLPAGSEANDLDEWPVTRGDDIFETVEEANTAALVEVSRVSLYEGEPFPNVAEHANLAQERDLDTGAMSLELRAGDGGIVQVAVGRELRARRDSKQIMPPATISRTVYHIKQKTTTREVVDDVLETERFHIKESFVGDASHTDLDQANDIAINHYVYANYRFEEGTTPNLSKRTEACKPRIEALKDSLLVEQLFHGDAGEAQVEVWVEKGKIAGPRNL